MKKSAALPYRTILVIDSSEREETNLALLVGNQCFTVNASQRAQELPILIDGLLSEQKLLPAHIDAIALVKKPGSVTAIRIGTAVANTLAWLGRKHIIEISAKDINQALDQLANGRYDKVVKVSLPFS